MPELPQQVGTSLDLIESASFIMQGQADTFTALVILGTGAAGAPGGTVTFMVGTMVLGTADVIDGQAVLTTTGLPAGSYDVTAVYSGSPDFFGSVGANFVRVISPWTIWL